MSSLCHSAFSRSLFPRIVFSSVLFSPFVSCFSRSFASKKRFFREELGDYTINQQNITPPPAPAQHTAAATPSPHPLPLSSSSSSPLYSGPRPLVSRLFSPVILQVPGGASFASHQLLLRGGYIRQVGSGLYSLLPLANRVIHKLSSVIESELQSLQCQRVDFPLIAPTSLWDRSGRSAAIGNEVFRVQDRKGSPHLMLPTHEELATALIAAEINTYKSLPMRIYQIGKKFRDEPRPRAGLIRGREFLMMDLYTFDRTKALALDFYDSMLECYGRIFDRVGLPAVKAEADSGSIGGSITHEYHLPISSGEDTIMQCNKCEYTANIEAAQSYPNSQWYQKHLQQFQTAGDPNAASHSQSEISKYAESLLPARMLHQHIPRKFEVALIHYDDVGPDGRLKRRSECRIVFVPADSMVNPISLKSHVGANEAEILGPNESFKALKPFLDSALADPDRSKRQRRDPLILIDESLIIPGADVDDDAALFEQPSESSVSPRLERPILSDGNVEIFRREVLDEMGEIDFFSIVAIIQERAKGNQQTERLMRAAFQKFGERLDADKVEASQAEKAEKLQRELEALEEHANQLEEQEKQDADDEEDDEQEDRIEEAARAGLSVIPEGEGSIILNPREGIFRQAQPGDHCLFHAQCGGRLEECRGIELGHAFFLGTRYSAPMEANFKNAQGKLKSMRMGCYGIGVSRLMAAAVEASHDQHGIVWPVQIAPYRVAIIAMPQQTKQSTDASGRDPLAMADALYDALQHSPATAGEVLIDDQYDASLGHRLKHCQLIGIPILVILGRAFETSGLIEVEYRHSGVKKSIQPENLRQLVEHFCSNPPKLKMHKVSDGEAKFQAVYSFGTKTEKMKKPNRA